MSDGFTGTNTEKIDALIQAFVSFRAEQRTTSRIVAWVVGLGVPIIGGLVVSLVAWSFRVETRLGVLETRVAHVESRLDTIDGRLGRIEGRLGRPGGEGPPR